jgi:uncharacterized UPF0160 family protein
MNCKKEQVMLGNGSFYNPFDLHCKDFYDVVPIARSLSRAHRFLGQTDYTTAQHCVVMAEYFLYEADAGADIAHWALLHEVAEVFMGDVASPIKAKKPEYKAQEEQILERMAKCLNLPYPMPKVIKRADKKAMYEEAINFMPNRAYWEAEAKEAGILLDDSKLTAWSMDEAKWRFINCHKLLTKLRGYDYE